MIFLQDFEIFQRGLGENMGGQKIFQTLSFHLFGD